MSAQVNIVTNIDWGMALRIWWKLVWRAVLWGVLFGITMGIVVGVGGTLLHVELPTLRIVSAVFGVSLGICVHLWVIRTIFNKKYSIGRYRLAIVDEGEATPHTL